MDPFQILEEIAKQTAGILIGLLPLGPESFLGQIVEFFVVGLVLLF